jgi:predicted RNase H-like nuclease (RuvC/YqgF family)
MLLLLLQSRYDQLEAQASARGSLYDKATEALEEQGRELREARAASQRFEAEVSLLRARLDGVQDSQSQLREAKEEIRRLETQLADTLSDPFFAEGEGSTSKTKRLRELEESDRQLRTKSAHLEGTVRSQHEEIELLRQEREKTHKELDDTKEELIQ